MPASVICGLQWGDEGKGKVTDLLAADVSLVVRYQGGDNAGHTVVIGDETFKLHLVPSGALQPHIQPIIGPGVVVNPRTLLDEIAALEARGVEMGKLRVSAAAHVIMPYHVAMDGAPQIRGRRREMIGTTKRGIGPATGDRALRTGIRMGDLLDPDLLRARLTAALAERIRSSSSPMGCRPRSSSSRSSAMHSRGVSDWRHSSPIRRRSCRLPWHVTSSCCSKARRARCSILITARIRTSRRRTRLPAEHAPAGEIGSAPDQPGNRRAQGVLDTRRCRAPADRAE